MTSSQRAQFEKVTDVNKLLWAVEWIKQLLQHANIYLYFQIKK